MLRIGIVDQDEMFVKRLTEGLKKSYPEKLKFLYFSDLNQAQTAAGRMRIHLLLLNDINDVDSNNIPRQCRIALLRETRESSDTADFPTVFKYQSIGEWHSTISDLCKENKPSDKGGDDLPPPNKPKICLFTSGSGGVGASVAATAFCKHCCDAQIPAIYMSFETIPSTSHIFKNDGNYGFDDILFALRSSKCDLEPIIKKCISKDDSGIYFVKSCRILPDMFSLTGEEIVKICEKISDICKYKVIVLDMPFSRNESFVLPYLNSDVTVVVSDGSNIANEKLNTLLETLPVMCGESKEYVYKKTFLLYNRFSTNGGRIIQNDEIGKLGGINKCDFRTEMELIKKISDLYPYEKLVRCLNV